MSERDERGQKSSRQPAEGVRIIKAEEAQAALEAGEAAGRRPDDQLRFGDVPPAPSGPRPAHRFPLPDSVDPAEAVALPPLAPRRGTDPRRGPLGAPGAPEPGDADETMVMGEPDPAFPDAEPAAAPATPGPFPAGRRPVPPPPPQRAPLIATGGEQVEADAPPWAAGPSWEPDGADRTTEMGVPPSSAVPDEGITVSGAPPEMPHWSEPPTGEVPRLRFDDDVEHAGQNDDMEAWRALGARGVRWRDEDDWNDHEDLSELADDVEPIGALDQNRSEHSDLYSFDEDFERVAANRTGSHPVVDLTGDDSEAGLDEDESASALGAGRGRAGRGARPWERAKGRPEPMRAGARRGRRAGGGVAARMGGAAAAQSAGAAGGTAAGATAAGAAGAGAAGGAAGVAAGVSGSGAAGGAAGVAAGASGSGAAGAGAGGAAAAGASTTEAPRGRGAPAAERRERAVTRERPGARPAGRPPAPTGGDMGSRVVVGVALIVLLAIAYAVGAKALVALSTVIVVAAAAEAYNMTRGPGFRPATLLGIVATVGCVLGAYWKGIGAIPVVTVLLFGGAMLWYVLGVVEARPLANVAVTVMVFVWVSVLGSFSSVLLQERHGKGLFLGAVIVAVAADVCAFVVGRWIGSRPLAAHISPHKTIEGFVGGVIGAVIVGAIIGRTVHPWSGMRYGIVLGLVVGLIAPAGDLFESMLKRDLGIKDSGSILGGHGGLLDRFDGILLALPAAYFVATIAHL